MIKLIILLHSSNYFYNARALWEFLHVVIPVVAAVNLASMTYRWNMTRSALASSLHLILYLEKELALRKIGGRQS